MVLPLHPKCLPLELPERKERRKTVNFSYQDGFLVVNIHKIHSDKTKIILERRMFFTCFLREQYIS